MLNTKILEHLVAPAAKNTKESGPSRDDRLFRHWHTVSDSMFITDGLRFRGLEVALDQPQDREKHENVNM